MGSLSGARSGLLVVTFDWPGLSKNADGRQAETLGTAAPLFGFATQVCTGLRGVFLTAIGAGEVEI